MNLKQFFEIHPQIDAVARDWMDEPIGLVGIVPGGPNPTKMCCGDPRWFWTGVQRIITITEPLPEGFPEKGNPVQSLRFRNPTWNSQS